MTIVLFPSPKPATAPAPDPVPFDQAEIDRLYWDDSVKVADITKRFGLRGKKIGALATPKPTDVSCLVCGGTAVVRSRSKLKEVWIDCGTCGAGCRQREERYGQYSRDARRARLSEMGSSLRLVAVSAALVRRRRHDSIWTTGVDAYRAFDALADMCRPLEPGTLVTVIDPADGIAEIREALRAQHNDGARMLGVPTLRTLGDSQTESLQNLYSLTQDGWRIVSGNDIDVRHTIGFREMEAVAWGERHVHDDRWVDESDDGIDRDLSFGDRLINATADRIES